MLISGFTFARNTEKLGYPTVESIRSILPICDEFIITVGKGDADDTTHDRIAAIGDPKIRIIHTEWTDLDRLRSRIYSQQTNLALDHCTGTWCFYLQSDEIIHEKYLPLIQTACSHFADDNTVNGFLFNYKHFWGDYDHYIVNHRWYPREIRIVRRGRGIVSIGDAQSFRHTNGNKVAVVALDAEVFHYGWVRDPRKIHIRKQAVRRIYHGVVTKNADPSVYDFGSLEKLRGYCGTYPAVMQQRVDTIDWKHLLQYSGKSATVHGHDRIKYRLLTFIEQKIFRGSGHEFWGNKQYRILQRPSKTFSQMQKTRQYDDSGIPITATSADRQPFPAATLIIAVYNRPDFLEKVFCSLRNQSRPDFEIIVADYGSGQEIASVIDRYRSTFLYPLQHIWHDDDGFRKTITINKAVCAAHAPYCIFIDGDCILHHRFIESHLKRCRTGTVLSGCRVMMNRELSEQVTLDDITSLRIEKPGYWWKNGKKVGIKYGIFIPGASFLKNILRRTANDILGSNFSIFREDFLSVNGYDERIVGRGLEDDNLRRRFFMAGIPVKTLGYEARQYHLYHQFDRVPHNRETVDLFRNHPHEARTPFGIVKSPHHC